MLFKLILALIITSLFMLQKKSAFQVKPIFQPLILTPVFGLLFRGQGFGMVGFSSGITLGIVIELLWGRQLVDYEQGLKYPLLVSLLTLALYILTGQISLFFNLFIVLILVYSFQESSEFLRTSRFFSLAVFLFTLVVLNGDFLLEEIMGVVPAQFFELLSISAGIIPVVGLASFLIDGLNPSFIRDNIWYFSYVIATILSSLILNLGNYYGLLLFLILWYGLYYGWKYIIKILDYKEYLRWIAVILVIIVAPLLAEISSPFKDNLIQYLLWVESLLALFVLLSYYKLTNLEGYFIITLLGLILANVGIFI